MAHSTGAFAGCSSSSAAGSLSPPLLFLLEALSFLSFLGVFSWQRQQRDNDTIGAGSATSPQQQARQHQRQRRKSAGRGRAPPGKGDIGCGAGTFLAFLAERSASSALRFLSFSALAMLGAAQRGPHTEQGACELARERTGRHPLLATTTPLLPLVRRSLGVRLATTAP
eukprot:scaffold2090_cov225-Prasinococcus_capsulatus_cf.AAC.22